MLLNCTKIFVLLFLIAQIGESIDSAIAVEKPASKQHANATSLKPVHHTPHALSSDEAQSIETGSKALLADPMSAIFDSPIAAVNDTGVIASCVGVNSKNKFGGYAGKHLFLAILQDGKISASDRTMFEDQITRNRIIAAQNEEASDRLRASQHLLAMVGLSPYEQGHLAIKFKYQEIEIMQQRQLRQTISVDDEAEAFMQKFCKENVY